MAGDVLYFLHRHFRMVFVVSLTLGGALACVVARSIFHAFSGG